MKSLQPQPRYRDFSIFQRWRPPPPWILKFRIFNGEDDQEGRTTTPRQISLKSAQPRPRYRDFSIFQDGGSRHPGFLIFFLICNSRYGQEGRTASVCQISSKSLEPRDRFSRFMAQMTWFRPRMVLFGVRTMSDIIWGIVPTKPPKRGVNRHFQAKLA